MFEISFYVLTFSTILIRRNFSNNITIQTEINKLIGNILYYDKSDSARADKDKTRIMFNSDNPDEVDEYPASTGDNIEIICLAEGQAGDNYIWFATGFAKEAKGIYFH